MKDASWAEAHPTLLVGQAATLLDPEPLVAEGGRIFPLEILAVCAMSGYN
jgi:hypothetical protein